VFLPTSQWSLRASQGAEGSLRNSGPNDTPRARSRDAERICRALVAFTTPDGAPVLRRPLSPPEVRPISKPRWHQRAERWRKSPPCSKRPFAVISSVRKAARAPRMCFPLARLPLWSKARCRDEP
jgi:hypothetical protein